MKKVIWSIVLSRVYLAFVAGIGICDVASAYDGKVCKKGDEIMSGVPRVSGYLFARTLTEDGKISTMPKENLASQEAVTVDISDHDKKLFESIGVYFEVETHPLAVVELDGRHLCININDALSQGNIISEYPKSEVEGVVDLTSDLLFAYALKLNNVTVDDDVIIRYVAHCDRNLVEKNQADSFIMADLKKEYAAKLEKALGDVDSNKVFRIESQLEVLQYDMDKQTFPLKGLWCPQIKTNQPDVLAKIGFYKWDDCALRFVNAPEFMNVLCETARAKGFYDMRKVGKVPTYNKPLTTSYAHIRFLDKKVRLLEEKNKVYHNGNIKSMPLVDLYGKMAIEAQTIEMGVYHLPFLKISDFEFFHNYSGLVEMKQ